MHVIAAALRARDGCREELLEHCRAMLAPSNAEEGCVAYRLYTDPFDPDHLFFYEEWKDREAIETHFSQPFFITFQEQVAPLVDGDPDIVIH